MTLYDFSYIIDRMDLEALKKAIRANGVQALSRKTGLSRSTIHDFANLDKGISLKNLEILTKALGFQMNLSKGFSAQDVLGLLLLHQKKLKAAGIEHLALFGSVARGTHRPESDIDLLITPSRMEGLRTISGIQKCLEDLLPGAHLDLVFASSLKPQMKKAIKEDALDVF